MRPEAGAPAKTPSNKPGRRDAEITISCVQFHMSHMWRGEEFSGHHSLMTMDLFLEISARTGRFTRGAPRAMCFGADGRLLCFLRARNATDPVEQLWALDTSTNEERLIAEPRALIPGLDEHPRRLPTVERQLRERLRLWAPGIGSYALCGDGSSAVFTLDGRLFRASTTPRSAPEVVEVPVAGPAFDPRPTFDGSGIAYVADDALHLAPGGRISPADGARWGIAEFAAAEELGRTRGHWWSPDGASLLAARVDESALPRRYFTDPAHPELASADFAYPQAGGPNADVQMWVLRTDAEPVRLEWDAQTFPYVSDAAWASPDEILLTVQDRLQQQVHLLSADPASGRSRTLSRTTHPLWVDPVPGTPSRLPDGRLLTAKNSPGDTTRSLAIDGRLLTREGLQVRRFAGMHDGQLLVEAGDGHPAHQHVLLVDPDSGTVRPLSRGPGVHSVLASGGTVLLTSAGPDTVRRTVLTADGGSFRLRDRSVPLPYRVSPLLSQVTEHGVPAAVVFPRSHVTGQRLPVLLDVYGGPLGQAVASEPHRWQHRQWWADQGFAVVTVDNRGTPYVSPAFTHAVHRGFSAVTLEDQVAALRALAAKHADLDLNRVGVRGWSYGGYLAALAVLRRPDVFHAGVAGAPPTDFRHYDTAYTERYLGLPQDNPAGYEEDCLLRDAHLLDRPLLLIHGLADDNVHPSHSLRLSQALTEAGRPHQFLALPGVSHMTPDGTAERLAVLELDFIRGALRMSSE